MVKRGLSAVGLVVFGILIGFGAMKLWEGGQSEPAPIVIHTPVLPSPAAPTAIESAPSAKPIQVFVNGAVAMPDVYVLPPESRVKQAVDAAGGFKREANTAVINLALPLVDGMHIYVPEMLASPEVPQQIITQPTDSSRSGIGGMLVNINTADLEELEELPGIGPVTAQKIIDYRAANGAFPDVETILKVSGIGEVTFEKIRKLITVR